MLHHEIHCAANPNKVLAQEAASRGMARVAGESAAHIHTAAQGATGGVARDTEEEPAAAISLSLPPAARNGDIVVKHEAYGGASLDQTRWAAEHPPIPGAASSAFTSKCSNAGKYPSTPAAPPHTHPIVPHLSGNAPPPAAAGPPPPPPASAGAFPRARLPVSSSPPFPSEPATHTFDVLANFEQAERMGVELKKSDRHIYPFVQSFSQDKSEGCGTSFAGRTPRFVFREGGPIQVLDSLVGVSGVDTASMSFDTLRKAIQQGQGRRLRLTFCRDVDATRGRAAETRPPASAAFSSVSSRGASHGGSSVPLATPITGAAITAAKLTTCTRVSDIERIVPGPGGRGVSTPYVGGGSMFGGNVQQQIAMQQQIAIASSPPALIRNAIRQQFAMRQQIAMRQQFAMRQQIAMRQHQHPQSMYQPYGHSLMSGRDTGGYGQYMQVRVRCFLCVRQLPLYVFSTTHSTIPLWCVSSVSLSPSLYLSSTARISLFLTCLSPRPPSGPPTRRSPSPRQTKGRSVLQIVRERSTTS